MLIKLQRHRFSEEYIILEDVRQVSYSDSPHIMYDEKQLEQHLTAFVNVPHEGKRHAWYCIHQTNRPSDTPATFHNGYGMNRVSFLDDTGTRVEILFDGEAFVCNDEGKTIQRIKRGGC